MLCWFLYQRRSVGLLKGTQFAGFQCNCGCTGMIFCARQLVVEHDIKTVIVLKKTYDSVPSYRCDVSYCA